MFEELFTAVGRHPVVATFLAVWVLLVVALIRGDRKDDEE